MSCKKTNFIPLLLLIFVSGCQINYVQLFKTKPNSPIRIQDYQYVYENDSLKIEYDFWVEHGAITFTVYNKMNVPIYIDWRKSSYIRNEIKLDYWSDVETTNATTDYKTYTFGGSGTYYNNGFVPGSSTINSSVSKGTANTTAVKTKPERISFLAPKSKITRTQFTLFPSGGIRVNPENAKYAQMKRSDDTTKTTTVIYRDYEPDASVLSFRNFLTLSTTENFTNEFYVDNAFYVNRISIMDKKHFEGKFTKGFEYPYEDSRYFYIYSDEEASSYYSGRKFKEHSNK